MISDFKLKVNINTDDIFKQLKGIEGLAEKAISLGLNESAFQLRKFWIADINTFVKNPTAFTKKVFVNKSRPDNLIATTFLPRIQSEYLNKLVDGGIRRPGDYATLNNDILVPVKAKLNKFGNFNQGPSRWLSTVENKIGGKKGAFVGSPGKSNKGGVYQRLARGRLKLLAIFVKQVEYDKQLPLERTAELFGPDANKLIQTNLNKLLT